MRINERLLLTLLITGVLFLFGQSLISDGLLSIWGLRMVSQILAVAVWGSGWVLGSGLINYLFPTLYQAKPIATDGSLVVRGGRGKDWAWWLTSVCLGQFIFSMLVFVLGLGNLLHEGTALFLVMFINGLGWRQWRLLWWFSVDQAQKVRRLDSLETCWLALLVVACAACWLFSFAPPLDFDVLGYHLGAPWDYALAGGIVPQPYNVYAYFPQLIEMQAFVLFLLFGDPMTAGMAAHQLIVGSTFMLVVVVYALSRQFMSRQASLLAALVVMTLPWTCILSQKFYVEIPLTCNLLLVVWLLLSNVLGKGHGRAVAVEQAQLEGAMEVVEVVSEQAVETAQLPEPAESATRQLLVVGLILGAAAGIKYNAIFFGVPAVLLCLIYGRIQGPRLRSIMIVLCTAGLAFCPWLIRNFVDTGNLFYPLVNQLFGSDWLDKLDTLRWNHAHAPRGYGFGDALMLLKNMFVGGNRNSILLLFFLPGLVWRLWRRDRIWQLVGLFVLWACLWYGFTHRIDRFMYPALVILVVAAVSIWETYQKIFPRFWLVASVLLLLFFNGMHLGMIYGARANVVFGHESQDEYLDRYLPAWDGYRFINDWVREENQITYANLMEAQARGSLNVLPGQRSKPIKRLLMIGDPKTYYITRDIEVTHHSVFDVRLIRQLLSHEGGMAAALEEGGYELVFVNWAEIKRYQATYKFPLPGGGQGDGFLMNRDLVLLSEFLHEHALKIYPDPRELKPRDPKAPMKYNSHELFVLKSSLPKSMPDPRRRLHSPDQDL